jgi:hypothetical protein
VIGLFSRMILENKYEILCFDVILLVPHQDSFH